VGLGEIAAAFGEGARRTGLKVVIEPQRLGRGRLRVRQA
jgi:hypothetical protein